MYLLKMLLCSAILYAYYRLALYNERFHQWNRFYLLAAMVLSVVVPFISIPVMASADDSDLVTVIASLPWNVNVGITKQQQMTWQNIVLASAVFISIIFLVRVMISIIKIIIAYHSYPVSTLQHNVQLVITKLTEAPFSFFNWLFWRHDIDPASANGQRMLTHELTHIREHHSIDKLFTSLLLCVFWMNPFFWLMRRELSMIHEFLADRKAIRQQDGAAFAEMILQALPLAQPINNGLVNPFFSSQIKRRLLMITTSKDAKYSYLRRISGLALMICSVLALAISIQRAEAQQADKIIVIKEKTASAKQGNPVTSNTKEKKTSADSIYMIADTIIYHKNKKEVIVITSSDGQAKLAAREGNKNDITVNDVVSEGVRLNVSKNPPLYMLDGKEIDAAQMKDVDPNDIKAINVFKGESAVNKYGEKGKFGAVEITLKTKEEQSAAKEKEIVVKGYATQNPDLKIVDTKSKKDANPLFYVDGKAITREEMNAIKPNDIKSISILKDDSAIKKYGEKAKDGVVEITLKKPL